MQPRISNGVRLMFVVASEQIHVERREPRGRNPSIAAHTSSLRLNDLPMRVSFDAIAAIQRDLPSGKLPVSFQITERCTCLTLLNACWHPRRTEQHECFTIPIGTAHCTAHESVT